MTAVSLRGLSFVPAWCLYINGPSMRSGEWRDQGMKMMSTETVEGEGKGWDGSRIYYIRHSNRRETVCRLLICCRLGFGWGCVTFGVELKFEHAWSTLTWINHLGLALTLKIKALSLIQISIDVHSNQDKSRVFSCRRVSNLKATVLLTCGF